MELVARFKGRTYRCLVGRDEKWLTFTVKGFQVSNRAVRTPSAAAKLVARHEMNGWRFWSRPDGDESEAEPLNPSVESEEETSRCQIRCEHCGEVFGTSTEASEHVALAERLRGTADALKGHGDGDDIEPASS